MTNCFVSTFTASAAHCSLPVGVTETVEAESGFALLKKKQSKKYKHLTKNHFYHLYYFINHRSLGRSPFYFTGKTFSVRGARNDTMACIEFDAARNEAIALSFDLASMGSLRTMRHRVSKLPLQLGMKA